MDKINCIQHRIVNCGVKVVNSIPKAFGIILLGICVPAFRVGIGQTFFKFPTIANT